MRDLFAGSSPRSIRTAEAGRNGTHMEGNSKHRLVAFCADCMPSFEV